MTNVMNRKVAAAEAVDLSKNKREGKYYVLDSFVDGADYCDLEKTTWIWSIGRRKADGVILASTSSDLYQNAEFECLWLR